MQLDAPRGTGNGFPSFRWNDVGSVITGTITSKPDKVSTESENVVFEVHTNEPISCRTNKGEVLEGQDWTIWIRTDRQIYSALYDAVVGSGGKLLEGGQIAIQLVGHKDTGKANPMGIYEVAYKPPAVSASSGAASVADLLG